MRGERAAPRRWSPTVLLAAAGALGIAGYVVPAMQRIGYPYELTYFEGSTVEVTARLLDGLPIYAPPSAEFVAWPYPPMYFWLTAGISEFSGLSLPTMRLVSFAASLIVLGLIALIVWWTTGSRVAALLGSGLYAATYRVAGAWADTARVDSVVLAWLLAAVAVAMRARTWRGGAVVGLLVVAAFLTKQNAILAAAPLLVALVIRRRAAGVAASVVAVVGSLATLVVGDIVTDGWYSPSVAFQLTGQPWAPQWLLGFWAIDVLLPFALLVVVAGWVALRHRREWQWPRASGLSDQGVVVVAAVIGLLAAGISGRLHDGGTSNVAMPAHVAVAIALAIAINWAFTSGRLPRSELWVLGVAVLSQVVILLFWRTDIVPTEADRTAGDRFIDYVAALPGPVLIPSHPYYARLAGKPTTASTIPVVDMLASRSNRARDALAAQLPWPLAGYTVVIADSADDAARLGTELQRDFTLVTTDVVPGDAFEPVTDVPAKPSLVFVRTAEPLP